MLKKTPQTYSKFLIVNLFQKNWKIKFPGLRMRSNAHFECWLKSYSNSVGTSDVTSSWLPDRDLLTSHETARILQHSFFFIWINIGGDDFFDFYVNCSKTQMLADHHPLLKFVYSKKATHFLNPSAVCNQGWVVMGYTRDTTETIEPGPLCITDLFQNKSVAYF